METHHEFFCGCTVSFELIEFEAERVRFEFEIEYCAQHDTAEIFVGADWLRFDLKALPEEEKQG